MYYHTQLQRKGSSVFLTSPLWYAAFNRKVIFFFLIKKKENTENTSWE